MNCFRWQEMKKDGVRTVRSAVDANHAGCVRTRKSTTCLINLIGHHAVQNTSVTQGPVSLSSGESEYRALVRAAVEAL